MDKLKQYASFFPGYVFVKHVGKGSYGDVYHCIRKSDKKDVVLKIIRSLGAKEDGLSITTIREIKFLRYCKHPCIVNVFDMISANCLNFKCVANDIASDQSGGKQFSPIAIVMEYVDNDILGLIKAKRNGLTELLPIDAVRWIMFQLFSVLNYLHMNHIIHRDIKSANILVTRSCNIKLADFGLSRFINNSMIKDYTSRVITLWYRPPELLLGATNYGPEVDIWSAGCIFVELLTGRSLFNTSDDSELSEVKKIFKYCGSPTDPYLLDLMKKKNLVYPQTKRLLFTVLKRLCESTQGRKYKDIPTEALNLIDMILQVSPKKRPTAGSLLQHDFFRGMKQLSFTFPRFDGGGFHYLEVKRMTLNRDKSRVQWVVITKGEKDILRLRNAEAIDLTQDDDSLPRNKDKRKPASKTSKTTSRNRKASLHKSSSEPNQRTRNKKDRETGALLPRSQPTLSLSSLSPSSAASLSSEKDTTGSIYALSHYNSVDPLIPNAFPLSKYPIAPRSNSSHPSELNSEPESDSKPDHSSSRKGETTQSTQSTKSTKSTKSTQATRSRSHMNSKGAVESSFESGQDETYEDGETEYQVEEYTEDVNDLLLNDEIEDFEDDFKDFHDEYPPKRRSTRQRGRQNSARTNQNNQTNRAKSRFRTELQQRMTRSRSKELRKEQLIEEQNSSERDYSSEQYDSKVSEDRNEALLQARNKGRMSAKRAASLRLSAKKKHRVT